MDINTIDNLLNGIEKAAKYGFKKYEELGKPKQTHTTENRRQIKLLFMANEIERMVEVEWWMIIEKENY